MGRNEVKTAEVGVEGRGNCRLAIAMTLTFPRVLPSGWRCVGGWDAESATVQLSRCATLSAEWERVVPDQSAAGKGHMHSSRQRRIHLRLHIFLRGHALATSA